MDNTRTILFCLLASVMLLSGCAEYRAYRQLDRAVALEANGDREKALAIFQATVDICPEDAVLRRWLGRAYLRRSQYDAARVEFETALGLAPDYMRLYRDLAIVNEALERPEVAIAWLEKAVSQVPAHRESYRDLVSLYLSHDRLSKAQTLLETVIEQWPKTMWAHFQLGGLYMVLKWPERAEEAYVQVLNIEPKNDDESAIHARSHGELGNVYYERKNYEGAEEPRMDICRSGNSPTRRHSPVAAVFAPAPTHAFLPGYTGRIVLPDRQYRARHFLYSPGHCIGSR